MVAYSEAGKRYAYETRISPTIAITSGNKVKFGMTITTPSFLHTFTERQRTGKVLTTTQNAPEQIFIKDINDPTSFKAFDSLLIAHPVVASKMIRELKEIAKLDAFNGMREDIQDAVDAIESRQRELNMQSGI